MALLPSFESSFLLTSFVGPRVTSFHVWHDVWTYFEIFFFTSKSDAKLYSTFLFLKYHLTLIRPGFLRSLKTGEGGIPPAGLSRSYGHNFHPNSPKMDSKDFWHNYPSMKTSKTILWFKFFPKQGAKVTSSDKAKFSASRTKIFENI